MIDINLLRENPDVFRASQRARGKDETHVDRILEADTARRALIGEYETLRAEQNAFGKTVAKAPKEEKPALVAQAKELAARLRRSWNVEYDDAGAVGRRYRRQDEVGTPFCLTYDFDSPEDGAVTVRERDTMEQERVPLAELESYLAARLIGC